jgi:hypothetical protein
MSPKWIVRGLLAGLALLGAGGWLAGTRPATASPQSPAPSATPSAAPSPAPAGKDPLKEFVPHEHVPADSAVSFPVDI